MGGIVERTLIVATAVGVAAASAGCVSVSRSNVTSAGGQTAGEVASPAVSADGQVVAFVSDAPDLVAGDTNGVADVFVHDVATGRTERVSTMGGAGGEKLFPTTTYALSPDGRRVAFEAILGELLPGIGPPVAFRDWVGVHDRTSHRTDVAVDPTQLMVAVAAPQYLDGGFLSTSQTLFVGGSSTVTARITPFGGCAGPALVAGDGHWCVQPATTPAPGLLLHAPNAGTTNVVLDTELTTDGAVPTAAPTALALSSTGRFVAFASAATNHVAGDGNGLADVFVVDRDADADGVFDEGTSLPVDRVSVAAGTEGTGDADGASSAPALSADGRYVVFASDAANLVAGDTNGSSDVFRYDRAAGTTERVSVANGGGAQASGASFAPVVDAAAQTVVFLSSAGDLVGGDTNGATDVFRRSFGTSSSSSATVAGLTP